MEFPQYRVLEGAETLYVIEGPRHAIEFQPLGLKQWVSHAHVAADYPRFVWLQELRNEAAHVQAISREVFLERLQTREVRGASSQLGRFVAEDLNRNLNIASDVTLQERTTFGVPAATKHHALVHSDEEVRAAMMMSAENNWEPLILGGGSNVLMHSDWPGLTIEMNIKGIEVLSDDGNHLEVVVGAGESWHAWVLHAVKEGWNGLENLALIPGSVGASPMQNIGAYLSLIHI